MQIEIIESIANVKKYVAVTVDGQCNHGGEMVEEDIESDIEPHQVVRCSFCERCGAQYNDLENEWIENLSSKSHTQAWNDYFLLGAPMPKFELGQPIVHKVIAESL